MFLSLMSQPLALQILLVAGVWTIFCPVLTTLLVLGMIVDDFLDLSVIVPFLDQTKRLLVPHLRACVIDDNCPAKENLLHRWLEKHYWNWVQKYGNLGVFAILVVQGSMRFALFPVLWPLEHFKGRRLI